eukprot:TRINITY_DN1146_c0_g1_i1.p1 TRINITY_DN1146_c0_g1~~TRINITY_DN1146_c0_g1_i1.p1  ORF type:complete len:388 (-),score=127.85 TRINITY_DN1146_c0_g1_i1:48-1211(-)
MINVIQGTEMVKPTPKHQQDLELVKIDLKEVLEGPMKMIEETLEKWIPRQITREQFKEMIVKQRFDTDIEGINAAIFSPIWELLNRGGKRWRSTLLLIIAEAFGKKPEEVIDFLVVTEIIHNGTLIIDDIEDSSDFRRGKPCLHLIYGVDIAVNAGNMMYFLPLRVLEEKKKTLPSEVILQCYETYTQEMINVHVGQGLDICWHSRKLGEDHEPSIENYLHMCANKTGALARMASKLSAIVCGASPLQVDALGKFAESIGIAFQIQDDLLNLTEGDGPKGGLAAGKGGIGEDIHEGKRTLMVIHSFLNGSPSQVSRLKEILSLKTHDQALIREAIDILESNGSMEFARNQAKEILKDAWNQVDSLLPHSRAKAKLKALTDFLIDRSI